MNDTKKKTIEQIMIEEIYNVANIFNDRHRAKTWADGTTNVNAVHRSKSSHRSKSQKMLSHKLITQCPCANQEHT